MERRHTRKKNKYTRKEEREKEKQEKKDNRGPRAEMGIEKGRDDDETRTRYGCGEQMIRA